MENQFGEWLRVQVVRGGSKLKIGGKKDGGLMSHTKEQIRGEGSEVGVERDRNMLRTRAVESVEIVSESNSKLDTKDVGGTLRGGRITKVRNCRGRS